MICPRCQTELDRQLATPEGLIYKGVGLVIYKYTCPSCGYFINLGD